MIQRWLEYRWIYALPGLNELICFPITWVKLNSKISYLEINVSSSYVVCIALPHQNDRLTQRGRVTHLCVSKMEDLLIVNCTYGCSTGLWDVRHASQTPYSSERYTNQNWSLRACPRAYWFLSLPLPNKQRKKEHIELAREGRRKSGWNIRKM